MKRRRYSLNLFSGLTQTFAPFFIWADSPGAALACYPHHVNKFLLLLVLSSCGEAFVERKTVVSFDPSSASFWGNPLPSELRRQEDGTLNLEKWPGEKTELIKMWLTSIDDRVRGWGVSSGAFFPLNAAIDVNSLPTDVSDSLQGESAVQLIDVTVDSKEYGRRFPVKATFTTDTVPYRPTNLLAVTLMPGFVMRPNTTYAVILTDVIKDTAGQPIGRSKAFHNALLETKDADAKAVAALKPLIDYVKREKRNTAKIVGATVFTTIDVDSALVRLATWAETLPVPTLENAFVKADEHPDFTVYTTRYLVPQVQTGIKPGYGRIQWNADKTAPIQKGTQSVRLVISIPKKPMPAAGYPLMVYFHGSGGEYREVIDRGPLPLTGTRPTLPDPPPGSGPAAWLGRRGISTLGFDFPLHGDRESPPDTSGLKLYNLFGDIDSTIDNFTVAAFEAIYLSRLLETIRVQTPNGEAKFDVQHLSAMGHSMGSTLGIPISTVSTRYKGFIFSGAGGLLLEVATETTYPVKLRDALQLFLGFEDNQVLDRNHPLLHAFQSLWDFVDPVAKARHVAKEPLPNQNPKPYFLPQGLIDGYFNPGAQTAIGGALGTTIVGEELHPQLPQTLRLDGRGNQPSYPLKNNLNGVTAGTVMKKVPFELGHYIAFDTEDIRSQLACFVLGVGSVDGPKIVAPRALDAACD
jgi:hypothetical protein